MALVFSVALLVVIASVTIRRRRRDAADLGWMSAKWVEEQGRERSS